MRHLPHAIRKIAVLLTALSLLMVAPASYATEVDSAPLSASSAALDGMVRVYLSSLGSPSTLNVTIAGSYSINGGTALSSGETLTVGFSSSTGAITLTRNGTKTNMGTYFVLRRHSASGSNGVKIAQARRPGNPYPGDLSFRAVRQSSGSYKLYTVAHVYIESYLYGVLPYEMGDSASLEALKAQAVAARTYTVRMMSSRSSGYYDVVDTTSDQVYNGTPSGYANCESAVNATKGIVLMYGSSYATTYYSASNGGQTESVANIWDSSGYPYLIVKDDPFDYANTAATVKRTTVYANCSSANNSSLMALLKTKAVSALQSAGYSANAGNTTLQAVVAVTPHSPKYASPSKLYTKLDFALTATTSSTAGASVTASATVTCDIFSELESMLGMSIQSSKNELWTVRQSGSNFVLEARRYGHGLGLSQRGAMYMGTLGYPYDQILGFYFPGCKRVAHSFTNTILSAGSSDPVTSVEDAATVVDGASGCTGVALAALSIRASKSDTGAALCRVAGNTPMSVLSGDGTWCFVQYGEIKGYVQASALSITGTVAAAAEGEASTVIWGFASVSANGSLNLRASGSLAATIVGTASNGSTLTVLEKGEAWSRVQSGALAAYASNEFLSFSETDPVATPDEPIATVTPDSTGSAAITATVATESGSLNMRMEARAGSTILTTLPKGAQVAVTAKGDTWTAVSYGGINGYVMTMFLQFTGESAATPTPGANGATATVTTPSGSLNLRAFGMAGSTILRTIPQYATVAVLTRGAQWCQVTYENTTGYVMTVFLTFNESVEVTPTVSPEASVTPEASASPEASVTPEASETPAVTPSPTPVPSVPLAIVTTFSGSLNLRQAALPGSRILTRIPNGTALEIEERLAAWSRVSYDGYSGYVMNSYLTFTGTTSVVTGTATGEATTAWVLTSSGTLNLRESPSTGARVLTELPRLAELTLVTSGDTWCEVRYEGLSGYVMTKFLSMSRPAELPATLPPTATPFAESSPTPSPAPTATSDFVPSGDLVETVTPTPTPSPAPSPTPEPSATPTPTPEPIDETLVAQAFEEEDSVYDPTLRALDVPSDAAISPPNGRSYTTMYAECSEQSEAVMLLSADVIVSVLECGDTWCLVAYEGQMGYCLSDELLGG